MKNKCKTCGKNSESEYCFLHKPKKAIHSMREHSINFILKNNERNKMQEFFMSIWNKRPHKSEVSGEILFSPPPSTYFHHILGKEKYNELKFCEDNIILLSLQEHGDVEGNMYKFEYINKLRKKLKEKYL